MTENQIQDLTVEEQIIGTANEVKETATQLLRSQKTNKLLNEKVTAIGVSVVQLIDDAEKTTGKVAASNDDIAKLADSQEEIVANSAIVVDSVKAVAEQTNDIQTRLLSVDEQLTNVQTSAKSAEATILAQIVDNYDLHASHLNNFGERLTNIQTGVEKIDYKEQLDALKANSNDVRKNVESFTTEQTESYNAIMEKLDRFEASVSILVEKANAQYNSTLDIELTLAELTTNVDKLNSRVNELNIEHKPKSTNEIMDMFKSLAKEKDEAETEEIVETDDPEEILETTETDTAESVLDEVVTENDVEIIGAPGTKKKGFFGSLFG